MKQAEQIRKHLEDIESLQQKKLEVQHQNSQLKQKTHSLEIDDIEHKVVGPKPSKSILKQTDESQVAKQESVPEVAHF